MSAVKMLCGALAAWLTCAEPGFAAVAPPGPAPALDGLWRGPLQLPGGKLNVLFRVVRLTTGDYFATLDAPLQREARLAVTVVTRADTVFLMSAEANSNFAGRLSADGNQLQGTWQQPGFLAPLTLTRTALAPADAPALPAAAYREEEVAINNPTAKLRLAGTLTVPPGVGPFPAVVLLSDGGAHDRNGTVGTFAPLGQLADYLTRRGIAVLRFDDRGTGQSSGAALAVLPEQVSDAQAALTYLRSRPEINRDRLGLVGHGEGGNLALLTATLPAAPAFVVGLAPYGLPGAEVALQQQDATLRDLQLAPDQIAAAVKRQQAMFEIIRHTPDNGQAQAIVANMLRQNNPNLDRAAVQTAAAEMVSARYRHFLDFDPGQDLPNVTCPVLLLYGTADLTLNAEANSAVLVKGLRDNKAVTLRKLPGVNHLFQPEPAQWPVIGGEQRPNFSPAAAEAIGAWVAEQATAE